MPELPEVETVVRDLRPLLVGRAVTAVRAGLPGWLRVPIRASRARIPRADVTDSVGFASSSGATAGVSSTACSAVCPVALSVTGSV